MDFVITAVTHDIGPTPAINLYFCFALNAGRQHAGRVFTPRRHNFRFENFNFRFGPFQEVCAGMPSTGIARLEAFTGALTTQNNFVQPIIQRHDII